MLITLVNNSMHGTSGDGLKTLMEMFSTGLAADGYKILAVSSKLLNLSVQVSKSRFYAVSVIPK